MSGGYGGDWGGDTRWSEQSYDYESRAYGGNGSGYDAPPAPSLPPPPANPTLPPPKRDDVYGAGRPQFSEDGRGQPYSSMLDIVGPAAINKDISYDTSSRDPAMLRSRVFIGNILRGPIVREDLIELFRPFGQLLAVTFFKGYAFVQFTESHEADAACEALNGRRWKGTMIDVHLAMEGMGKKPDISRKRRVGRDWEDRTGGGVNDNVGAVKRAAGADSVNDANEKNRQDAQKDHTPNHDLADSTMADTLICGSCRFVTCNFAEFRDHRKKPCIKPKDAVEPPVLRCASCGLRYLSAWNLLHHLTEFHRMCLWKADFSQEAIEKAKIEEVKHKEWKRKRMIEDGLIDEDGNLLDSADKTHPLYLTAEKEAALSKKKDEQQRRAETNSPMSSINDDKSRAVSSPGTPTYGSSAQNIGFPQTTFPRNVERVTTGQDYNEDEEDDDYGDGNNTHIPTLG